MTMYRWVGRGYVPGKPARDMTEDEATYYGVTDHPLYVRDEPPKATRKPRPQAEFVDAETMDEVHVSEFDAPQEGDQS